MHPRPTSTAALALLVLLGVCGAAPALAADMPYVDPQSSGSLTLCDEHGQEIRSGATDGRPLASTVVGSTAAPQDYRQGGSATLLGYQPRKGLAPGQWSGELITGASRYTTPQHPTVSVLPKDLTLANFVQDFPTEWDGLVQLRVYLSAPGKQIDKQAYDTADLKVDHGQWSLVRGGGGSCSSGKAISVAEILGVPTSAPTPSPARAGVTTPTAAGTSQQPSRSTSLGSPVAGAVNASSSRDVGGGYVLPLAGGGLVALLVAGVSLLVRRRPASS